MNRLGVAFSFFSLLALTSADAVAAAKQYQLTQDPQAIAVARAAFTAMGGAQAVAAYQDSVASGTATIYVGGTPVSYPITMKSKGLRETRVEIQKASGANVRIVNQGQGAIVQPNGSIRSLYVNDTFYEHVNHVPLLSVLAEYATGNVNLLYKGVAQIQGQSEYVIEIDYVPNLDSSQASTYASMSRTIFFVNQSTSLIDKIQETPFCESGDETFTEETYFSDYHQVNGMLVPFHQTVFSDQKLDTDLTFTSVNENVGLSDSDFTIPQAR